MLDPSSTAVLFDLDGVLVDSRRPITDCMNHALAAHELAPRPREELVRFIGPPLVLAFAELTGEPPESTLVASCVDAYRDRYAEVSLRETEVVPGIPSVLAKLARRHPLAVATSKPLVYAEPLMARMELERYFQLCAGPGLDASGQEKSVVIADAVGRLEPFQAIMVGDRGLDIVGAHRCYLPAIAVTWGIGSFEELSSAHPEAIVEVPEELPVVIDQLLSNWSYGGRNGSGIGSAPRVIGRTGSAPLARRGIGSRRASRRDGL